jgi:hypothetical protein
MASDALASTGPPPAARHVQRVPRRWGNERHAVARERSASYTASANPPPAVDVTDSTASDGGAAGDGFERLASAVDEVLATDLDGLSDGQIRDRLKLVQRQLDRLTAFRAKSAGTLESRALAAQGPGRENRAVAPTRRFLTDELHLTPSEAKKTGETGRRLEGAPATAAAFRAGRLGAEHAKVITDTLRHVHGDLRDRLESELTELASQMDPVTLGREARRRLARHDQPAAVADEARRHARRYASVAQRPDGMVAVNALLTGVPGEAALTTMQAFTCPDGPGVEGSREQRAADALGEIFLAALQTGAAPTQHGIRPHVSIHVQLSDLARQAGAAELDWTGPITVTEIRRWLTDATLTGIVIDPDGVPTGITDARRTIAAAKWKALCARDGGCRHPGCTRPPAWCDVAHAIAHADGGPLQLSNLLLLCREHHRKFDLGGWTIRIDGTTVTFTSPAGQRLVSTRGDPP